MPSQKREQAPRTPNAGALIENPRACRLATDWSTKMNCSDSALACRRKTIPRPSQSSVALGLSPHFKAFAGRGSRDSQSGLRLRDRDAAQEDEFVPRSVPAHQLNGTARA